jgi:Secretion system C-terminal sorting domain
MDNSKINAISIIDMATGKIVMYKQYNNATNAALKINSISGGFYVMKIETGKRMVPEIKIKN